MARFTYLALLYITKMSNQHTSRKLVLLAGMLAAGLLASVFAATLLQSATAQAQNQADAESQPVITSMDNIDCSKEASLVHCVDSNSSTTTAASLENDSKSTLSTSGTATAKVKPDKFTVTVGVETNGTTAQEATSKNANLTADVIAALKDLGVAEDQVSTSSYNVNPVYEQKPLDQPCIDIYPPPPECQPKQQIIGYVASSSLSVTLDTDGNADAGKVIDTAIEAGANTVNGVFFFVSQEKQDEVRDSLIEDAIADARHRADIAAGTVDMQVSGIRSISLNDVFFPVLSGGAELQAADTQILPGEQEVTMTVTIVYFMSSNGSNPTISGEDNDTSATDNAVAIARQFILSKLPSLGIQIDNELDLHTDMVVAITESEYRIEFSVLDTNGQSHDGRIEVTNGEVTAAILDGESIL